MGALILRIGYNIALAFVIWGALINGLEIRLFGQPGWLRLLPEVVLLIVMSAFGMFLLSRQRVLWNSTPRRLLLLAVYILTHAFLSMSRNDALSILYALRLYMLPTLWALSIHLVLVNRISSKTNEWLRNDTYLQVAVAVVLGAVASVAQLAGFTGDILQVLVGYEYVGKGPMRVEFIAGVPRAFGLTYGHVEFALLSWLALLLSIERYLRQHMQLALLVASVSFLCVVMTFSRSILVSTLVSLTVLAIRIRRVRAWLTIAAAAGIIATSAFGFWVYSIYESVSVFSALTTRYGLIGRFSGPWRMALDELRNFSVLELVFGRGLGSYGAANQVAAYVDGSYAVNSPLQVLDSGWLLVLMTGGVVGVLLWLLFLGSHLGSGASSPYQVALIAGFSVSLLFTTLWDNPYMVLYWSVYVLLQHSTNERGKHHEKYSH